jgi:hypothetical protein
MKKVLMLTAAMNLGFAGAASTTVEPRVTVFNICATMGNTALEETTDGGITPEFVYDALRGDFGGDEVTAIEMKCTAGAPVYVAIDAEDGEDTAGFIDGEAFTGELFLAKKDSEGPSLKTKYRVSFNVRESNGNRNSADVYTGKVKLTAADNQWGVSAGEYNGRLTMTVSFN